MTAYMNKIKIKSKYDVKIKGLKFSKDLEYIAYDLGSIYSIYNDGYTIEINEKILNKYFIKGE